ncbi:MAG: hypothetical protein R3C99_15015 [Pirellulaceae bacterium]
MSGVPASTWGPAHAVTLQIERASGGRVLLLNVTQISDTADAAGGKRDLLADGAGSQIILTGADESHTELVVERKLAFESDRAQRRSDRAPILNTLRRVDVTLNGTGTLPVNTWQHWNDGVATLLWAAPTRLVRAGECG